MDVLVRLFLMLLMLPVIALVGVFWALCIWIRFIAIVCDEVMRRRRKPVWHNWF